LEQNLIVLIESYQSLAAIKILMRLIDDIWVSRRCRWGILHLRVILFQL